MSYVRCIRNETLWVDDPSPTYDPLLIVGHVYKIAPSEVNDGTELLRVVDEEGEDYPTPPPISSHTRPTGMINRAVKWRPFILPPISKIFYAPKPCLPINR